MSHNRHRERTGLSRRRFLGTTATAAAAFQIVPRHVIGGPGHTPPSETLGGALIGCGGRGNGTFGGLGKSCSRWPRTM